MGRLVLLSLMAIYRAIGTTHMGGNCRFQPSCSEYAVEAIQTLPPLKAIRLITKRLFKCRPGGPYGIDLVPKEQKKD